MNEQDSGPRAGDEAFEKTASALLRGSADDIDAATASRLNRARQAALGALPARRSPPWLVPALSTVAVGVLAVGLWLNWSAAPDHPAPVAPAVESAADMDLLLAPDNLEMLEDLDFYAWLDADLSDNELRAELESAG
ncbi:MAG: hypothetical protein ABIX37_02600 [Gammaproteobacteria bacterium]